MASHRDSSHPFGHAVLLAFVVTSWPLAVHALPLPQATSTITVNCRAISGGTTHLTVPAAASLACDEVTDFGTEGTFQGVVSVHTGFNPIPLADVQASASYRLGGRGGGGSASGQADIQYALRIQSTSPPPAVVFQVPVSMHLLADGEASSLARASARVAVENVLDRSFQTPTSGGGSFSIDSVLTLSLFPDLAYTVHKSASCSAFAQVSAFVNIPSSDCQSVIDPLFELDQAAFDLEMGPRSFRLADHFVLEQSPNLMVPEPSSLVLLGAGLGVLLAIGGRRRRSRSPGSGAMSWTKPSGQFFGSRIGLWEDRMPSEERRTAMRVGGALAVLVGMVLLGLSISGDARAEVTQQVFVDYEDPSGNQTGDLDVVKVPPDLALRTISASIDGSEFKAMGSVGVFGNLGVEARSLRTGTLLTQVSIFSDELVNPFSTPQHAQANFIVDGGSLTMLAGIGSLLSFRLELQAAIRTASGGLDRVEFFDSGIDLEETVSGLEFRTSGPSLGAIFDGRRSVEIPVSFQTFDLGLIPAGGHIDFDYLLNIRGQGVGFTEILAWQYSDPVQVSGTGDFPTMNLAVPEPSSLVLLSTGVLGLVGYGRCRKKARCVPGSDMSAGAADRRAGVWCSSFVPLSWIVRTASSAR